MFLPRFNFFRKIHFREFATKSQKHVLVKTTSTKISYNIYNTYNRNLRNDARSMLRERETERDRETERQTETERDRQRQTEREKQGRDNGSCHFLINIFFLVFYKNIEPSFSKTRIEYIKIKIRVLFRETYSG